ncbi:complexin-2-like [Ruditapes philippinarum]|uniref:complexin-2-like n=1 Tax=Ruditapes philippinarum TaxID=129788 RepID=UPI00295A801A|nr:complexin-2-like [Ruditapes philippinarum]
MAQVLVPPPQKTTGKLKSSRIVTEGRVISGDEMLKKLEEKEEVMRRQMEEKEERLRLKEQRKQQKEKEEEKVEKKKRREEEKKKKEQELKEERMKKAVGGRLAHKRFTCAVCGERGRVNDEVNEVMWYGCDDGMCGRWYHEECLGQSENEYLKESESDGMPWYCVVCKLWLYEEE